MTLAERLCNHCAPDTQADGFGAMMGAVHSARDLLSRWFGQSLRVADGVDLHLPTDCTWQTYDQSDGSVQISFTGTPPTITAKYGPLRVSPQLTALILRTGAAALEIQAMLRLPGMLGGALPETPFTLTIPLR